VVEIIVLLFVAALPLLIVIGLFAYLWIQLNEIEPWVEEDFGHWNTDEDFDDDSRN